MDRKLASIQRIVDLQPIPDADAIEVAQVLGWKCVVKKGEFKVGDLIVYLEVDSLLPKEDDFAFMEKYKYRIKTIRLRKQISQGLVFPIKDVKYVDLSSYTEGDDVTEIMKVTKYDPELNLPAQLRGKVKGNFPGFLRKTDEIRIQSVPKIVVKYQNTRFVYTEKLDGSSVSLYMKDGVFGVCSRKLDLMRESELNPKDIKNEFWKTALRLGIEEKMAEYAKENNCNFALQGELIGPGIQKNKYHLKESDIYLYNAFNIDTQTYYDFADFVGIVNKLGLKTVPVLGDFCLAEKYGGTTFSDERDYIRTAVDAIVQLSIGYSTLDKVWREGIVCRPMNEMADDQELKGRLSFKAINPEFLLQHGE